MMTPIFSARITLVVWFRTIALGAALATVSVWAQNGSARLARGIEKFEAHRYSEAIADLTAAQVETPKLADYAAFFLASSRIELKDFTQAQTDLALFRKLAAPSPLEPRALLLEAKVLAETGSPRE